MHGLFLHGSYTASPLPATGLDLLLFTPRSHSCSHTGFLAVSHTHQACPIVNAMLFLILEGFSPRSWVGFLLQNVKSLLKYLLQQSGSFGQLLKDSSLCCSDSVLCSPRGLVTICKYFFPFFFFFKFFFVSSPPECNLHEGPGPG